MFRKRNKFGNTWTECDGYKFPSQLEKAVYQILKLRERSGEIKILQTQDHIYMTDARVGYIPDFKCLDLKLSEEFWVEAKGAESGEFKLKKRLYRWYGPGKLEIWKGSYLKPVLVEIIIPKRRKEE